ncbi:ATP-binding protein [Paraglaciecola sp.]|uniref:ATP-binding protein n=1 Tax=Paraglaciecola sp. TaxID=1920173 RepID=UPI003EF70D67
MSQYLINSVEKHETYLVTDLAQVLSKFYIKNNSWQEFTADSTRWRLFVLQAINKGSLQPPINRKNKGPFDTRFGAMAEKPNGMPMPPPQNNGPLPPLRMLQKTFISSRISLFDSNKNKLIEAEGANDIFHWQPIEVNGKEVGWLGLAKAEMAEKQDNLFLSQLFKQTMTLTIIGIVFSGVVSFCLARHFTGPIRSLTQGAINLSNRQFDTKISISSNDELADLAHYFNDIGTRLSSFETTQKQWLQDIAHELRTPLTVIRGEIEAMVDGVTEANEKNLSLLKNDVLRLNHLINDLHELSVTDNLLLARDLEQIDLKQVCDCAAYRFKAKLFKNNIILNLNIQNCTIHGDASRLMQVIDNLLENCVKYTENSGCVWIACYIENNKAIVSIEDSGPGVDNKNIDKLFDRLYRIDNHRNRTSGGAGLGLAICKNIVVAHHGDIQALPSDKGGLKVLLSFPINSGGD